MGVWRRIDLKNPAHQAFLGLWVGFTVAPILFGIDKFFDWAVNWDRYLAPWVNDIIPGTAHQFLYVVGGIEIAAGLLVLLAPRIGAWVVAAWLFGIIVNLLTVNPPQFYDIALRDLGLMLGALALARLASVVYASSARTVDRPERHIRAA